MSVVRHNESAGGEREVPPSRRNVVFYYFEDSERDERDERDEDYDTREYSCTCKSWHEEPCSFCMGDTPCNGGCGEIASECVCEEEEEG